MSVKNVNTNRMSATHFITGQAPAGKGGKKFALLAGASLLLSRFLPSALRVASVSKMAEGGMVPAPLVGAVSIKKGLSWVTGTKARADMNGFQRAVAKAGDIVDMPGDAMQTPWAAFRETGEGSVADRLSSTGAAKKLLGDDAAEKLNAVASNKLGFTGAIANGLGSIIEGIERQFGMAGRIDEKIAKKGARISELEEQRKNFENTKSRVQKAKEGVGFTEKHMASDAVVRKELEYIHGRLDIAQKREDIYNKLPAMEKERRRVAFRKLESRHKKRLDGLLEGVEEKEARESIIAGFDGYRNEAERKAEIKEDRKIIKEHRGHIAKGVAATEAKMKENLANLDGEVSSKAGKNLRDYKNTQKDVSDLKNKKKLYEDPKGELKRRMENITLSQVADFTIRYGAVAQQTIGAVKGRGMERRMLKQLIADVKGTDPSKISNWSVRVMAFKSLFGGLKGENPMIAEAVKQYAKAALATYIPLAVGAVGQEVAAKKLTRAYGDSPLISIGVSMGLPMLMNATSGLKGSLLETYSSFRIAQEAGEELGGNEFAKLLNDSSAMIRKMGGIGNYQVVLMAQYYAIKKVPVEQVMKDLSKGKAHMLKIAEKAGPVVEEHKKQQAAAAEAQKQPEAAPGNAMSDPSQGYTVGTGFFTGNTHNQPKAQGGNFTQRVGNELPGKGAGMGAGG